MRTLKPLPGPAWLLLLASAAICPAEEWTPLFNGRDLDGWSGWLSRPDPSIDLPGAARDEHGQYRQPLGTGRDPLAVFTVTTIDGRPAIRISGQVMGGLQTTREYGNYHLRLQFRWGERKWPPRLDRPRDSGLLYHVHSDFGVSSHTWPRSVEFQIQEHDVGDLYALAMQITVPARRLDPVKRLFRYDPRGQPTVFVEQLPIGNRCMHLEDREKPPGEWNTLDLVCLGDESIHVVNGTVVMRLQAAQRLDGAAPAPLTSGHIVLQSEGAEVYYRDVVIRPITAVPVEFAAP